MKPKIKISDYTGQPNNYIRALNALDFPLDYDGWDLPREQDGIMLLPDGCAWWIEGETSVGDILKPGMVIKERYDYEEDYEIDELPERRAIEVHRYTTCTCPFVGYFRKYCDEFNWDDPNDPLRFKYHKEVVHWTVVIVPMDAKPTSKHLYQQKDKGWINDLVHVNGRFIPMYVREDPVDEVFIVDNDRELPPLQTSFL